MQVLIVVTGAFLGVLILCNILFLCCVDACLRRLGYLLFSGGPFIWSFPVWFWVLISQTAATTMGVRHSHGLADIYLSYTVRMTYCLA